MKPGRNDPCPCGSGKKYKKCCYLGDQKETYENSAKSREEQEEHEKQEDLVRMGVNLLRMLLNRKPHIKHYHRIKKMHSEILSSMVKYHDDGKFEREFDAGYVHPKRDNNEPPVVYLTESDFDLDTDIGYESFYDMILYKSFPNASCITEKFIESNRYRKPEKIEFLNSMLNSKTGLYEVTDIIANEGHAVLKDVFTGVEHTITDIGMSGSRYTNYYIYTRIISYQGISYCGGLNFIFAKTNAFIGNHIRRHKADYSPETEFIRFMQVYNQYSKFSGGVNVVTNKLR
jgi:hypothetical protein